MKKTTPKTVEEDVEVEVIQDTDLDLEDPLLTRQREDVSEMRTSLLSCNVSSDPRTIKVALSNITILRIYHQLNRLIRYTEMMDKIEDKMYQSIERSLNTDDPNWVMLMSMQDGLQKLMIDSNKLLKPYMDMLKNYNISEMPVTPADNSTTLDYKARDSVRSKAQEIIRLLGDEELNG